MDNIVALYFNTLPGSIAIICWFSKMLKILRYFNNQKIIFAKENIELSGISYLLKWNFQIKLFIQQTCVRLPDVPWYITLKFFNIEINPLVITINRGLKPEDTLFFVHSHSFSGWGGMDLLLFSPFFPICSPQVPKRFPRFYPITSPTFFFAMSYFHWPITKNKVRSMEPFHNKTFYPNVECLPFRPVI